MGEESASGGGTKPPGCSGSRAKKKYYRSPKAQQPKFTGNCEELNGHVFDCVGFNQSGQFITTQEQLSIFVGSTYKHGGIMATAVDKLTDPVIPMPGRPNGYGTDACDPGDKLDYEIDRKEAKKKSSEIGELKQKLYAHVLGQCTEGLKAKIEAHNDWKAILTSRNGVALLKIIKGICFDFQDQKYLPQSILEAKSRLFGIRQQTHETVNDYCDRVHTYLEVVEQIGGTIGYDNGIQKLVCTEKGIDPSSASATEKIMVRECVRDRIIATIFVIGLDKRRLGSYHTHLENGFVVGRDDWPKTPNSALVAATNWKQDSAPTIDGSGVGMSFNTDGQQSGKKLRGRCWICGSKDHHKGHPDCPGKAQPEPENADTNVQAEQESDAVDAQGDEENATGLLTMSDELFEDDLEHFCWLMAGSHDDEEWEHVEDRIADGIDDADQGACFVNSTEDVTLNVVSGPKSLLSWLLLDSQSTHHVFSNASLLDNIRQVDRSLRIHTQAGTVTTNWVGDFRGFGTVWYCKGGIANILSLAMVKNKYRVTYDSNENNAFVIHKDDGTTRTFKQSRKGLYYLDAKGSETGAALVSTVADNKSKYTSYDYSRAVLAREIQKRIGRRSTQTFIKIVEENKLKNCPITKADILAAEDIFGPEVGSLKGKTARKKSPKVNVRLIPIPALIMERYQRVHLAGDIMKVNKMPFMVTISSTIKFGTVELLKNMKASSLLLAIKNVHGLYARRGFRIDVILLDGQFEPLRGHLASLKITLNTVARGEHVPAAERRIRTIKDSTRSTYNSLPFKKFPPMMVVQMVCAANFWCNVFPATAGVSRDINPRELITGLEIDYLKHCMLEYGQYVQVHEEHDNSMVPRTTGAIALRPMGNAQGGYYFYSLLSGRVLKRQHYTPLPMPADVVTRVHAMAKKHSGLEFTDKNGDPYEDIETNHVEEAEEDGGDRIDPPDQEDLYADVPPLLLRDGDVSDSDDEDEHDDPQMMADNHDDQPIPDDDDDDAAPVDEPTTETVVDEPEENVVETAIEEHEAADLDPPEDDGSADEEETNDVPEANEEQRAPIIDPSALSRREQSNLRVSGEIPTVMAGRTRSQNREATTNLADSMTEEMIRNLREQRAAGVMCPDDHHPELADLEAVAMTQLNMKQGIKRWKEDAVEAVRVEMNQLHVRKTVKPLAASSLSQEEKRAALQYLMFLKKKRCGKIKGRGCADGRKQRKSTKKEDASSPTVSIEAVMISCVIDALEGRDVAVADIPGAFMQAGMDEVVHVKLEAEMAEMLARLDPKLYRKHIICEKGKPVLYVELLKALYGTLRAALLFWRLLAGVLLKWGFEINPYDWCVANKMINGKQCTILWHVDDLKISHVDPKVVDKLLKDINGRFGKEAPISISRGKVHEYLGMTLDYATPGKVKIIMTDYVEKMLADLPADMRGEAATPAADHLFTVNENPEKLLEEKAQFFHHYVAKGLFLCKRARPDIQTAIAFLSTRVKSPDTDDYRKLARMMQYLRKTRHLFLTLEADNLNVIKWWADGSFAVHGDMRSHTGGAMSMGRGVVYGTSTRQKLTTRSSTEAELVAVDDIMSQVLWTRYFLEAQGYGIDDNVIYQDNMSTMLLVNNGRGSSSKRTRHINIRYFFVTDRVKKNEVRVEYCPTGDMVADYFTKPLQGSLFKKMRDFILNTDAGPPSIDNAIVDRRSVLDTEDEGQTWAEVVRGSSVQPNERTSSKL